MSAPYLMVSLLDLLRQNAKGYLLLGERIGDIRTVFYMADSEDDQSLKVLRAHEKESLAEDLKALLGLGEELDLPTACALLRTRLNDVPQTGREFDLLVEAFYSEISTKLLLFVPSDRSQFHNKADILSDAAKTAFPSAYGELQSAANCYALDLPTACVFHSMRALEHGLRALAADVGRTFDVQVWNDIINQIESSITDLGNKLPRGQPKSERLQFLGEAAKEFTFFKDGWRNYVSHGRATYSPHQALTVLTHARHLMERLSTHLQE